MNMTKDALEHMVNRFLGWKLPSDFKPDAGISFDPFGNKGTAFEYKHEPCGTNLFDAEQARAMIQHMLEGMPIAPSMTKDEIVHDIESAFDDSDDGLPSLMIAQVVMDINKIATALEKIAEPQLAAPSVGRLMTDDELYEALARDRTLSDDEIRARVYKKGPNETFNAGLAKAERTFIRRPGSPEHEDNAAFDKTDFPGG